MKREEESETEGRILKGRERYEGSHWLVLFWEQLSLCFTHSNLFICIFLMQRKVCRNNDILVTFYYDRRLHSHSRWNEPIRWSLLRVVQQC